MGPLDQRNLSKQKFRNLSNSKNLLNGIFRAKNSTMNNILTPALLRIVNHPACWPGLLLKCQPCCYRCTTKNKPWNQVLFSEMTFARFCNFNFCRSFWREILNFGWLHKLIFRKFTEPALLWLTLDFQSPAVHEQGQVQHHSDTNNGLTIISVLLHPCAASSQDSCPHWVNVTSSLTSRAQLFLPPANMLLSYQQVIYFPESLKCWVERATLVPFSLWRKMPNTAYHQTGKSLQSYALIYGHSLLSEPEKPLPTLSGSDSPCTLACLKNPMKTGKVTYLGSQTTGPTNPSLTLPLGEHSVALCGQIWGEPQLRISVVNFSLHTFSTNN